MNNFPFKATLFTQCLDRIRLSGYFWREIGNDPYMAVPIIIMPLRPTMPKYLYRLAKTEPEYIQIRRSHSESPKNIVVLCENGCPSVFPLAV